MAADEVALVKPPPGSIVSGAPVNMVFSTAKEAGDGQLAVSVCNGKKSGEVPCIVTSQPDSKYKVSFVPPQLDIYYVNVKWSGKHVPGSPYEINILSGNAQGVEMVVQPQDAIELGMPVKLDFNTSRASGGKLEANCVGAKVGKIAVVIKQNEEDLYNVSFTPPEPDLYELSILWGGKHVIGSPFKLTILGNPAESIKVVKVPPDTIKSGTPVCMQVDTSAAGLGKLQVSCTGNKVGEVDCQVQPKSDEKNKYIVSFVPPQKDIYHVHIKWQGIDIPGSPFTIDVLETNARNVEREEPTTNVKVGVPLILIFSTKDAGYGKLEATCSGEKSGDLPCTVQAISKYRYKVSFVPPSPDVYYLHVKWSGNHVPGSPFMFDLSHFADNVKLVERPSSKIDNGSQISFGFDTSEAGSGELQATCKGEKVGDVPCQVKTKEDDKDKYFVSFIPLEEDIYNLSVKWFGKHVKGSPFILNLKQPMPDKVKLVEKPSPRTELDAPLTMVFSTKEAGSGQLEASCSGEKSGKVPCIVTSQPDSKYKVSFVPPQSDIYDVDVLWSGKHVPGSPYKIKILPANAKRVEMVTLPLVRLGVPVEIDFDTSRAGGGKLEANCVGAKVGEIAVVVKQKEEDLYNVSFTLPEPDLYNLIIIWGGKHVMGSPFKLDTQENAAKNIKVVELPPATIEFGTPVCIQVDTSEAGLGKLEVSCIGNKVGEIDCQVQPKSDERNKYIVSFVPPQKDIYHLNIKWQGKDIPGSPFTINMLPPKVENVVLIKRPTTNVKIGVPLIFTFSTKDAGYGKLEASCFGEKSGNLPCTVEATSENIYNVSFIYQSHDVFHVDVRWSGKSVTDFPFILDPRNIMLLYWVQCCLPNLKITNFTTDWSDGIALSALVEHLRPGKIPGYATISHANALENIKTAMNVAEEEFQIRQVIKPEHFIKQSDEDLIMAYLLLFCNPGCIGETSLLEWINAKLHPHYDITNFVADWSNGKALAGLIDAISPGLFPNHASINPINPDSKLENVKCALEIASSRLEIKHSFEAEELVDGKVVRLSMMAYLTQFCFAKAVDIGCTFMLQFLTPDGSKVVMLAEPDGILKPGALVYFNINTAEAGKGNLKATCIGKKTGDMAVLVTKVEEDKYNVSFIPPKPDIYHISVKWCNDDIKASPFKLNMLENVAENVKLIKTPTNTLKSGYCLSLGFDTSEAGLGKLQATCKGEKVGDVPCQVKTKEDDKNEYSVSFIPLEEDIYHLSVKWFGKNVNGSPFKLNLKQSMANKVILVERSDSITSDAPINMVFCTKEAGGGQLVASCNGEKSGEVPCIVMSQPDSKYKVSFVPPQSDIYLLNVQWSGEHVPGSPYKIKILPANAKEVEMVTPPLVKLRMPVEIDFNTSRAGGGKLEANCVGAKVGEITVVVKQKEEDLYNVSFTLPEPDLYELSIIWGGKHVIGSPFKLDTQKNAAKNIKIVELPPATIEFGTPVCIQVDTSEAGLGKLEVSCIGNKVGVVDCQVQPKSDERNKYIVSFVPSQKDIYRLNIKWQGKDIPRSPFTINMLPPEVENVVLIEKPTTNVKIGVPLIFTFSTKDAGYGKLEASCLGEKSGNVPCTVEATSENIYNISFIPLSPDVYHVDVRWSGKSVADFPFKLNLSSTDARNFILLYWVQCCLPNQKIRNFTTDWSDGIALSALVEHLRPGKIPGYATISHANALENIKTAMNVAEDEFQIPQIIKPEHLVKQPDEGSIMAYLLLFCNPGSIGETSLLEWINAKLHPHYVITNFVADWSNGKALAGLIDAISPGLFPNHASINPDSKLENVTCALEIASSRLKIKHLFKAEELANGKIVRLFMMAYLTQFCFAKAVDIGCTFMLQLSTSDYSSKVVMLAEPDGVLKPGAPVYLNINTAEAGEGNLEATCIGKKTGDIAVLVTKVEEDKYNVSFIPPKPDIYYISVEWCNDDIKGSSFKLNMLENAAENVKLIKTPTNTLKSGYLLSLGFDTSEAGLGKLQATCKGEKVGDVLCQVKTKEDDKNEYFVSFIPPEEDIYNVSVKWFGKHVDGSPFIFNLKDNKMLDVPSQKIEIFPHGSPINMQIPAAGITARDISAYAIYELTKEKIKVTIEKGEDKESFKLSFKPKQPGIYYVHVLVRHKEMSNSPFKVKYSKPLDPNAVEVTVSGSEPYFVEEPIIFVVDGTEAGAGELSIKLSGPSSEKKPSLNVLDNKDGTYSAVYVPTALGEHVFDISWSGKAIKDSPLRLRVFDSDEGHVKLVETPFKVNLLSPPTENLELMTSQLEKPKVLKVGVPMDLDLNISKAGGGVLDVTCLGEQVGNVPVNVRPVSKDKYRITFTPMEADSYKINVKLSGEHVKGSPFTINMLQQSANQAPLVILATSMESGAPPSSGFNTVLQMINEL